MGSSRLLILFNEVQYQFSLSRDLDADCARPQIDAMNCKGSAALVRFSTRGRVTIPLAIRKKFGIQDGSRWRISKTNDGQGFFIRIRSKTV